MENTVRKNSQGEHRTQSVRTPKENTELRKPHREICSLCHEVSRVGFWVPNHIWRAAVHRTQINSIICLRCFTRLADERSVPWDENIKFFPVSWITHSQEVLTIVNSSPRDSQFAP